MIYTEHDWLSVIELKDETDAVSFDTLAKEISAKPSNTVYCERKGKLCGIISMGDIARADKENAAYVTVNKKFTWIRPKEYMKARNIFREKTNINALPVVNEKQELMGAYARWDDFLAGYMCEGNHFLFNLGKRVALVRPCCLYKDKRKMSGIFCHNLLSMGFNAKEIEQSEVLDDINSVDRVLFCDEDEWRAVDTLFTHLLHKKYPREKLMTYKNFMKECWFEFIGDYLRGLGQKGVHILNLFYDSNQYDRILQEKDYVDNREDTLYRSFFGELYSEEYKNGIIRFPFSIETESHLGKLKDCKGKYCNVINGERYTTGQPENYIQTIYFIGPCFIYGCFTEDKNTIESLLQQRLNDTRHEIRVVNCGSCYNGQMDLEIARLSELPLRKGDVVVLFADNKRFPDIPELNLIHVLDKSSVKKEWILGIMLHCNHKINALFAEAIYQNLVCEKWIGGQNEIGEGIGKEIGQDRDFVKTMYIDRYFTDFNPGLYKKIGSIVMNCNPFTHGHRYLIEQASEAVDFLIIFVVEEDESIFSFDERFAMVCSGTGDIKHVMVVPSGPFILSKTTFPEYFVKEADEDMAKNVENDITFFAERIAPHLNISYRFVGEEPEDMVTNEYNLAMKRILPENGIRLVEIPRKERHGKYISASSVRRCLEAHDMDGLDRLVPESTKRILFTRNH